MSRKRCFFIGMFLNKKVVLVLMKPTQKESDKMIDRESLLSKLLESGGKALDNELPAFQKKFQAFE